MDGILCKRLRFERDPGRNVGGGGGEAAVPAFPIAHAERKIYEGSLRGDVIYRVVHLAKATDTSFCL